MLKLPDWKQLEHTVEWDSFVIDILIPFCVKQDWTVDYEFLDDRWCVVYGPLNQEDSQDDWQRFITNFIGPFCQERGWQVENLLEDTVIEIHAPTTVEEPEPQTGVQQLNFFDLCPSSPKQTSHYQYDGE